MPSHFIIAFVTLTGSHQLQIGYPSLSFLDILAFKRIQLSLQVKQAAAQRPNVDFRTKLHGVLDDLWSRKVYMPSETLRSQKLLEIVW